MKTSHHLLLLHHEASGSAWASACCRSSLTVDSPTTIHPKCKLTSQHHCRLGCFTVGSNTSWKFQQRVRAMRHSAGHPDTDWSAPCYSVRRSSPPPLGSFCILALRHHRELSTSPAAPYCGWEHRAPSSQLLLSCLREVWALWPCVCWCSLNLHHRNLNQSKSSQTQKLRSQGP